MLRMLTAAEPELLARAESIRDGIGDGATVISSAAKVGGGALPLLELEGPVCALDPAPLSLDELAGRLRRGDPAVVGRARDGWLLLDPRTIAGRRRRSGGGGSPQSPVNSPSGTDRPPLTLGTAGHIDHGKTALVRALTGKDTDRLPEERERGISIDLGYAPLALPGGRRLSIVDVPGHERFVRTMVAGATGIDLFLMCVAADDGVMPQTREHAAILDQLGVRRGVVAVTKADVCDPGPAGAQAAELIPGAEVVAVSAVASAGLGELLAALERAAGRVTARSEADGPALLHLDRAFTLRGIGTVVTGTLWQGTLQAGEQVRIEPGARSARVRSVQVHDEPVQGAVAGQRVAVALAGIDWRETGRGDVVCGADSEVTPTYRVDVALDAALPIRHGERLQVHHGTREAPARVVPLSEGANAPVLAQLRLDAPIVPRRDDPVILRRPARFETVGGARVVDPLPPRHGPSPEVRARLKRILEGEDLEGGESVEAPVARLATARVGRRRAPSARRGHAAAGRVASGRRRASPRGR